MWSESASCASSLACPCSTGLHLLYILNLARTYLGDHRARHHSAGDALLAARSFEHAAAMHPVNMCLDTPLSESSAVHCEQSTARGERSIARGIGAGAYYAGSTGGGANLRVMRQRRIVNRAPVSAKMPIATCRLRCVSLVMVAVTNPAAIPKKAISVTAYEAPMKRRSVTIIPWPIIPCQSRAAARQPSREM